MQRTALVRCLPITVLLLVASVGIMAGQSARPAPTGGVPELLEEVRAMRSELRQVAASSMRMQLLVARLSLQEGRIAAVVRQLGEVERQIEVAVRERAEIEQALKMQEGVLTRMGSGEFPSQERGQMATLVAHMKDKLATHSASEQRLRVQESELGTQLAEEQSRWVGFNAQLDELERALPR